jgi:hypothetical protein
MHDDKQQYLAAGKNFLMADTPVSPGLKRCPSQK